MKKGFIFIVCSILLGIILIFGITWVGFVLQAMLIVGLFIVVSTVIILCIFIPIWLAFEILTRFFTYD